MRKRATYGQKLRIEFHNSYLVMALGFVLSGYFLNLVVFTVLILVHELGHTVVAWLFGVRVEKIIVYPYGGMTKLEGFLNRDIDVEMLIALSGVIGQFFFYMGICFLHSRGWVRDYTFSLFMLYNREMIMFNLLPIYPLDGGRIIKLIMEKFICYRLANGVMVVVSMMVIGVIVFFRIYDYNYANIMVFFILIFYVGKFYAKRKYLYERFMLERYLYSLKYSRVRVVRSLKNLYKGSTHIILNGKGYVRESKALRRFFEGGGDE